AWARSILTFQNPPGYRAQRDAYCRAHLPPHPAGAPATSRPARPLALRVAVRPRRVRAGRRTLFAFTATISSVRAKDVTIRFAGHRAITNERGSAFIAATLRR